VCETQYLPQVFGYVLYHVLLIAEHNHAVLDCDLLARPVVGHGQDGVDVHDHTVGELGGVVEVDEELARLNVAIEVANVHVSDLTHHSVESVLEESLDKELVIYSNLFRHNRGRCFAEDLLL